jgi:hypothetical protein
MILYSTPHIQILTQAVTKANCSVAFTNQRMSSLFPMERRRSIFLSITKRDNATSITPFPFNLALRGEG